MSWSEGRQKDQLQGLSGKLAMRSEAEQRPRMESPSRKGAWAETLPPLGLSVLLRDKPRAEM